MGLPLTGVIQDKSNSSSSRQPFSFLKKLVIIGGLLPSAPRSFLLQLNFSRFFNHSSYGVFESLQHNPPLFWVFSNPSQWTALQESRVVTALIPVHCSLSRDTFCPCGHCWSAREGEPEQLPGVSLTLECCPKRTVWLSLQTDRAHSLAFWLDISSCFLMQAFAIS